MDTDRRGFLRVLGSLMALLSGRASAAPVAAEPEIHRGTRNTAWGALGGWRLKGKPGLPYKQYPGKSLVALPEPADSGLSLAEVLRAYTPARTFASEPLSISELGALLHHTNGVTDSALIDRAVQRRAAPSAGALYSGEVYVIAQQVRGLEAGLYNYAVAQHRLVRLREGPLLEKLADSLEDSVTVKHAAAAIVLSNVFGRYTHRYANRGYRYALIDSGHIGENLRLTGSALGLADVSPLRFWDDSLNELLGLDGRSEAVCALHLVGREGAAKQAEARAIEPSFEEKQKSAPLETAIQSASLIERFHEASKLQPANKTAADSTAPAMHSKHSDLEKAELVELPSPTPSAMRVTSAIRKRRSARAFDPLPVSPADLSFVLQAAQGNLALERAAGVELDLVVHAVVGVEPGVYRYQPASHQLAAIRKGELRKEMVAACLRQAKAGSAAVGFVMAARLDTARSGLGGRRYRDLLIESGAIGQRIYLSAEAVGLAARNLAAYQDDRFNELLGLKSRGLAALHLTMLGNGD
jgi:SagB-type dehydrogenase family enzyme